MSLPSRRAIVAFLAALTLLVCGRLARSAMGASRESGGGVSPAVMRPVKLPAPASIRLESPGTLIGAPSTLHAMLAIDGLRPASAGLDVAWEARLEGAPIAGGLRALTVPRGGSTRLIVSLEVPALDRPAGLDLRVLVRDAGAPLAETILPFVVLPAAAAAAARDRLGAARIALFDPEGRAAPILALLGVPHEVIASPPALTLYDGDLVIVGPGGFARGHEDLGPILAARARAGMRILMLEQPTLPATLSADLRLWPSFSGTGGRTVLVGPDHPLLHGVNAGGPAGYFRASGPGLRPLLPPTRGNFRVIAGVRVGAGVAGQEGVRLLEIAMGDGSLLAVQTPLCADFHTDARARILMVNALTYLLDQRPAPARALLYGRSPEDLPACLGDLAPRLEPAGRAPSGPGPLLVPGDWQAPRRAAAAGLAPIATVSRFLRDGGTVVVLNPQPLVRGFLEAIAGASVRFESPVASGPVGGALPLFEGIAPDDLEVFAAPSQPQMRLRPSPGPGGIAALAMAPGVSAWRVAGGTLVAITLPDSCGTARTRSVLARLFTNLGVPLDQPSLPPTAAAALLD